MSERRLYFRIDDYLDLEYLSIDDKTVRETPAENLFPGSAALKAYAELKKMDSEASQLFYQIKDKDRQIADYLHLLNRKIELISQQLISEPRLRSHGGEQRHVNISEGGLAFSNGEALSVGQYVALNLTFLPTYVGLAIYARVSRCEPVRTGGFEIAAEFEAMTESQQHILSQQIMRAQMADKRRYQDLDPESRAKR
ncbi:PilZ domain-containing protein [Marinimicrobium agarilyticum]|uniref:PilZ domain-containing protein n=1 Tax=Marinimicrobium agarilyticum TaxID=306546 RepID=UPI0004220903|nr:PilZ domain-containing protein [Marinimicrobium agarilyticum]